MPVLVQVALFHADDLDLAVGEAAAQFQAAQQVVGMGQGLVGVSQQLVLRISDKVAEGVVDAFAGRSVGRVQDHAHGGVVEHAAQHGVLAAKLLALADFPGQPVADQQGQNQHPGGDVDQLGNDQQGRVGQRVENARRQKPVAGIEVQTEIDAFEQGAEGVDGEDHQQHGDPGAHQFGLTQPDHVKDEDDQP